MQSWGIATHNLQKKIAMMAKSLNQFSLLFPLLAITLCVQLSVHSFTVDLIHRDSPQSPLYNPFVTKWDRLNDAFRRSMSRAARINKLSLKSPNGIQSEVVSGDFEYLMKLSIGSPLLPMLVIIDTGSDLTWIQCKPCSYCYPQVSPIFDPKHSKTYKRLHCASKRCKSVFGSKCQKKLCVYGIIYGDGSYTIGHVAAETFTFQSTSGKAVSVPNKVFGCGQDNQGIFENITNGLIGLGRGPESIINQRPLSGKFSYCLLPDFDSGPNITSKISFGESATVSGPGVVSTPLVRLSTHTLLDTLYYLTLLGVAVGNKTLGYQGKTSFGDTKNIIIDSGTTLTYLPSDFYTDLESELKKIIRATPVSDPPKPLNLCYSSKEKIAFPTITLKFKGAEIELSGTNTFFQISADNVCLNIVPSNGPPIIGNIVQRNFLIGYDLEKNVISFKKTDCTKH